MVPIEALHSASQPKVSGTSACRYGPYRECPAGRDADFRKQVVPKVFDESVDNGTRSTKSKVKVRALRTKRALDFVRSLAEMNALIALSHGHIERTIDQVEVHRGIAIRRLVTKVEPVKIVL